VSAAAGPAPRGAAGEAIRLLLCGDVMLGRGIDQILPHSNAPAIDESWRGIYDARTFVDLAVRASGPLPPSRDDSYVWGDLLSELAGAGADLRLVNLETAVTTSNDAWPNKNIRYRMHPGNLATLLRAKVDCCALANNHVLDWGYRGLGETIAKLHGAGIRTAGAGANRGESDAPAVIEVPGKGRVAVFSFATPSSFTPPSWAAAADKPGVGLILLTEPFVAHIAKLIGAVRPEADIVVVSLHWGGNWGHEIAPEMRAFAHRLIDEAGVDVIHGHSPHHVRAIEVYGGRLVLYGCGDLIDDYEGVTLQRDHAHAGIALERQNRFRPQLGLIYRAELDSSGALRALEMTPVRIRQLRANRADADDARWLEEMLNREGKALGTSVVRENGVLKLRW